MKLPKIRTVFGAMTLTVVALITTTGSAFADPGPPNIDWDHIWSAHGATVYVEEHGDIIFLCDSSANGHRASAQISWLYPDGVSYWMVPASNGKGTCSSQRASDGGWSNLPENETIFIDFSGDDKNYTTESFVNDH